MRYGRFFLLIAIAALLQATVLDYFKIFSCKPDLILVYLILGNIIFEFKRALFLSIFAGLLKDALSLWAFSINTPLFAFWSFLIAKLKRNLTLDDIFVRILLVLVIALLQNLIVGVRLIFSQARIPLGTFVGIAAWASIYTAAILPLSLWADRRFSQYSRASFKKGASRQDLAS
jgi:rod shape-determining protein MreD